MAITARLTAGIHYWCLCCYWWTDKSVLYTHQRTLSNGNDHEEHVKKFKILPYYVDQDLQLLKNAGMSKEDIDLFVEKLMLN